MSKNIQRIGVVAGATVVSRIMGLVRDMLLMAVLGASALGSAFILAFTLPNLFRRLLGEGAMTSALVPVLAERMDKVGEADSTLLLNRVLTRLAVALAALLLVALVVVGIAMQVPGLDERWYLVAKLSLLLLPYLLPVCLAAIVAAALNLHQRFAVPALSQVFLNGSIILSCVAGLIVTEDAFTRVYLICGGVLVGGVLQLLTPIFDFSKTKAGRIQPDMSNDPALSQIWALLLPGLAGAAVIQVNVAISRLLAFSLNESATAILYIANRLVELPLGIFAIAITTVVFPEIARAAGRKDNAAFAEGFHHGLSLILGITFPAAAGLMLMAHPILDLLFRWGAFDSTAVYAATPVLVVYAAGIPAYALGTYLTRAFHARQDTRTPMQLAIINLVANLGGGLLLMQYFGTTGLALANVLAMVLHVALLGYTLRRQTEFLGWAAILPVLGQVLAASVVMALLVGGLQALVAMLTYTVVLWTKFYLLFYVVCMIISAIIAYAVALKAVGYRELDSVLALIFRSRSHSG